MTITEIIQKAANGTPLSQAERTFAATWQPPADTAEIKNQLQTLLNAKQTETQRLAADLERLNREFAAARQQAADAEAKAAKMTRQNAISALRQQHGIHFIGGVDPAILTTAFEAAFESVGDLADQNQVTGALAAFRAANPSLIIDASGAGTGLPPKTVTNPAPAGNEAIAKILADAKIIK